MKLTNYKMADIYEGLYDGPHATPPTSEDGAIFLGISNITRDGHIDLSDIKHISVNDLPKWTKRVTPKAGDIVFSYEATLNLYAIIPEGFWGCLGRRMALIRPDEKKAHGKFLFYYFFSPQWRATIAENTIIGATVDRIPIAKFPDFPIQLPDIETQHRIASILSAYDNLIENNQRQIKLLEEASQRLYKEWFVDLHFPGYEDTVIIDGVPDGWRKEKVGKLIGKVQRTTQIKTADYLSEGTIPVIDQSRNFIAGYTNDISSLVKYDVPVIVFGDHTRILKLIPFPFAKGADGTQLILSVEANMPQRLLYCSLVNVDLSNFHYARHFKYLKEEEILVPDDSVAQIFEKNAKGIFDKIQVCRNSILQAQQYRDRLLPKLMSGEIEV